MAPISIKKGLVDRLAGDLIRHTLKIDKSDENFKVGLDYVMSNLRFHRFLDVNPLDVSKSLSGLCSKFLVNSQDKKASYLEELVEQFVNQPLLEEEKETQTDAHYSLLSVMFHLSNNPLNSKFIPKNKTQEKVESEAFDWTAYLLHDEEKLSVGAAIDGDIENELNNSDEELWTFSEDEVVAEPDDEEHIYAEIIGMQKKLQNDQLAHEQAHAQTLHWLQENVIPSYWLDNDMSHLSINDHRYKNSNSNMLKNWELYKRIQMQQNRHGPIKYQFLIERQLVKETLWMLQGVEDLFVYRFDGTSYIVNNNIAVNHLTKETLVSYLSTFTATGSKVVALKKYATNAASGDDTMSKTFRAFGFVLGRFLMARNHLLSQIEKSLIEKDENVTLAVLKGKLLQDSERVSFVHQLFVDTVIKGHELYSTVTERVVYFLDVFYNTLCSYDSLGNIGLEKVSIILPMFLDVCEPYLHDLEQWMIMGDLPSPKDEEFMIYKVQVIEKGDSNYWGGTYKIKETNVSLVPKLVQNIQKQVLLAGKSLGLLAEFGKFATCILSSKRLHPEFVDNLKAVLQESNERFLKGRDLPIGEYVVDGGPAIIEDPTADPLIQENFQIMFLDSYKRVHKDKGVTQEVTRNEHEKWLDLLKDGSCRPPIQVLIEKSLFPAIRHRYDKACAVLLELFNRELNLFKHLEIMRNFFLMQVGGTMHTFYSEIFEKAKRKEFWQDMPFLNIVMQDALQLHYPYLMGSLTVGLQAGDHKSNANLFDPVSLHYKAVWPMTIILDVETEVKYNELFRFLLKVQRAIWALEQLRFHELVADASFKEANDVSSSDEDEPIRRAKKLEIILTPDKQKLKIRMLVLRMKMMHVIRNLQFYLMTRIQKTSDEFHAKLKDAKDLDEIMELHQLFLHNLKQRSFLHEKIGRSREAIFRILSLVFDFEVLWLATVNLLEMNKLTTIEKDFNRCTSFLNSFFTSLAKRGSYPHFEFLANALKTESKGHNAVFRR